ncbi:hypothetical protein D0A37_08535 [Microcoleus vaginatus HSN003]|nr:hypothetical protein D0A37_08535 [Microcoleus vaginatus HSN003]
MIVVVFELEFATFNEWRILGMCGSWSELRCAFRKYSIFAEVVDLSFVYRLASESIEISRFFLRVVKLKYFNFGLKLMDLEKIAVSSGLLLKLSESAGTASSGLGLLRA